MPGGHRGTLSSLVDPTQSAHLILQANQFAKYDLEMPVSGRNVLKWMEPTCVWDGIGSNYHKLQRTSVKWFCSVGLDNPFMV
jgi:hypothetical protein